MVKVCSDGQRLLRQLGLHGDCRLLRGATLEEKTRRGAATSKRLDTFSITKQAEGRRVGESECRAAMDASRILAFYLLEKEKRKKKRKDSVNWRRTSMHMIFHGVVSCQYHDAEKHGMGQANKRAGKCDEEDRYDKTYLCRVVIANARRLALLR